MLELITARQNLTSHTVSVMLQSRLPLDIVQVKQYGMIKQASSRTHLVFLRNLRCKIAILCATKLILPSYRYLPLQVHRSTCLYIGRPLFVFIYLLLFFKSQKSYIALKDKHTTPLCILYFGRSLEKSCCL